MELISNTFLVTILKKEFVLKLIFAVRSIYDNWTALLDF
jgi:hypothetical protein